MVRDIETEWANMDEESKLKKYWERAMRKAYNEFKSEYEKDIADLNRRMPEGAKVSIETFPSLLTILELFREKMEHMRGHVLTADGAYDWLVNLEQHGRPVFSASPLNLPAMADEDVRRWVHKKKFDLEQVFKRFAKELIKATKLPVEAPGKFSWWTVLKVLDKMDKFITWSLKHIDRLLDRLLGKEAPPTTPPSGGS